MGYNIYAEKNIERLKATLKNMGYVKDYPKSVFGVALMVTFGMGKERAIYWLSNFETVGKIKIIEGVVNFIEN